METIALVGPYGTDVLPLFAKKIGQAMKLVHIQREDEFDQLAEVDYVVLRVMAMNAQVIESMKRVKLIQRWGVGFDKVDIVAAGQRGVAVAIAPGANATPVSELALLLMLAVYRNLIPLHEGVSRGQWEKEKYVDQSFVIRGKTVGLVGCGAIGLQVAKKVQAFGASVLYHDVRRLPVDDEAAFGLTYVERDQLLAESDIVSLHLPLLDTTRKLIDAQAIGQMKPGAILINTARGEIVDTEALAAALRSGHLRGAGLDVFEREPLGQDSPLHGLPNVVFTPHTGGNTGDISGDMVDICLENILTVSQGRALSSRVLVNGPHLQSRNVAGLC